MAVLGSASRFAERMAIRVAADAELHRDLKPQQASRALNALRDIGVVERARHGRWYVIDPLLRRYLAQRRLDHCRSCVRRSTSPKPRLRQPSEVLSRGVSGSYP